MTNFKSILCAGLSIGVVAVASAAVDKVIGARGATVLDNSDANVRITTAGSGGNNKLEKVHTSVLSLQQETTTASTLRLLNGELFSVDLLSILSGKAALTVGNTVGVGRVESLSGPLTLNNASGNLLTLNADVSVPSNVITKTGTGGVAVYGAMVGDLDQRAGSMTYYASEADGHHASLTVTGDGSLYGVATRYADRTLLKEGYPLGAGVKAVESVLTTSGVYPFNEMQVNGGSIVRLNACDLRQQEVTEDDSYWYDEVPECVLVGSNSVGVLKIEGGTFQGKIAIGAGSTELAKGAVFIGHGADVRNYCNVNGDLIFGRSGYAYLEVAGGATNTMYGYWQGGCAGQLNIVVTNGTFAHADAAVRPAGFGLLGENGNVSLFVGSGGRFEARSELRGAVLDNKASVTVADGGVFDIGPNVIELRGDSIFNVNVGGIFRSCGVKSLEMSAMQFDGGVWQMPNGADFDTQIFVRQGGVSIEVLEGETARITGTDAFKYSEGRGIASIFGADETVFLGPPSVEIVGDGFGASAICEWDRVSGLVTGIRVTGSGADYTSASASLRYGGVTKGSLAVTLKDVTSGEIVKTGAGTLELCGMTNLLKQAVVREGTLRIGVSGAISRESSIRVEENGTLDLGGFGTNDIVVSGYYNAGRGTLDNGVLTLEGLVCDFELQTNRVCVLDMAHLCFSEKATVRIPNVPADLDRNRGYDLYRLTGGGVGSMTAFPRLDDFTYGILSKAWGIVLEPRTDEDGRPYKMAVLRYIGGSLFIYY